jgi:hypothetical protein
MVEDGFLLSAATSDSNILRMPISRAQWELLKNTPVESLRWKTKTIHLLEYARCRNLGDVFSITKEGWAERRFVGKKSVTEMVNRIQKFLKIKRIIRIRRPCDTSAIEQKIRTNHIHAALAEAFAMGGLTAIQIKVLELRYGLTGTRPLLLRECGKIMQRTRQWMQLAEMGGKRRLSRHPTIRRAFRRGLRAIQDRLWRQLTGRNKSLILKSIGTRALYKRVGGPESLLVKVCYGNARKWLNQNLTSTPKGWRLPVLSVGECPQNKKCSPAKAGLHF